MLKRLRFEKDTVMARGRVGTTLRCYGVVFTRFRLTLRRFDDGVVLTWCHVDTTTFRTVTFLTRRRLDTIPNCHDVVLTRHRLGTTPFLEMVLY